MGIEPSQRERVDLFYESHTIRTVDYLCNGTATVIGVALIAFGVCFFMLTHHSYGFAAEMVPWYTIYSAIGLFGTVFTGLSVKWMIDSCKKANILREAEAERSLRR